MFSGSPTHVAFQHSQTTAIFARCMPANESIDYQRLITFLSSIHDEAIDQHMGQMKITVVYALSYLRYSAVRVGINSNNIPLSSLLDNTMIFLKAVFSKQRPLYFKVILTLRSFKATLAQII